jgi:xylulokinase
VIVAGGAGDGAASAVGIGAVKPGDGFLSLGTSGVLFVVNDRFRPNPGAPFTPSAIPCRNAGTR